MNNASITIELDTTPPILEIHAPKYSTREIENHITVEANETLSSYQEIYIIDSTGNRYDFQFKHNDNKLIGIVKFNQLSFGTATLHIRVKDEVDNLSQLYQHKIEIKDNISRLRMDISHSIRPIIISNRTRNVTTYDSTMKIMNNTTSRNMHTYTSTRKITTNIEV